MKFADFEVDVSSGELRRDGVRLKIQDLPFRVLVELLNHAGEVVTRDQLRAALWGAETFVDAEAGLNTAIAKLREALGDNAETPRFVETLPKRGYRFIEPLDNGAAAAPSGSRRNPLRRALVLATVITLAALAFAGWKTWLSPRPVTIAVVLFHNETGDAAYDRLAQQLTDATVVALAANPRSAVIGNAAILRTPRIFADLQQIGETLRADFIVVAQVQRPAASLVVRAHLIRVRDQKHVWAKGIAGDSSVLDGLVARTIADAVGAAVNGAK